jgi:hypothetical protein
LPRTASEAQWQDRRKELETWASSRPESLTAKIALANWYISYAWQARGYGWADSVTEEGWKGMQDRLAKAQLILDAIPQESIDDPQYYYRYLVLELGRGRPAKEALTYFKKGTALARNYFPLYQEVAFYLLPMWEGKPGDYEAFMKSAADGISGEDGDIVYAYLTDHTARHLGFDTDVDDLGLKIDYGRAKKGFLASIAKNEHVKWRDKNSLAYLAAVEGDDATAKTMFLEVGEEVDVSAFGGMDKLLELRKKCGAQAALDEADQLERTGKLTDAEKKLGSFTSDKLNYLALRRFYLRQGMEDKARETQDKSDGKTVREMLDADVATAGPDVLADDARYFSVFGKWDKAEEAARRFDTMRPWNITGKEILLLCAIQRGDAGMADEARKAIVGMKTDRLCYKTAQSVLSGAKSWDDVSKSMRGPDQYLAQSAIAATLYYFATGKPDTAKKVAYDCIPHCLPNDERMLLESLAYGSLSRSLNPAALIH